MIRTSDIDKKEEAEEIRVIEMSDTVIDPRAVMVFNKDSQEVNNDRCAKYTHPQDTSNLVVLSSEQLECGLIDLPVTFPAMVSSWRLVCFAHSTVSRLSC